MPISDISEEEIKDWIKYFENYQAQNISANEQNDDLKFLNRLVDKKIDDEKRKSSKKTIDEEKNDVINPIPVHVFRIRAKTMPQIKRKRQGGTKYNSEEKSGKSFSEKKTIDCKNC